MHPQHQSHPYGRPAQQRPAEPPPESDLAAGVRTLAGAAFLTFAAGMLVLIGYMMIGGFGAFLGIFGAGFGIVWLAGVHGGKVFPRAGFPTQSIVGTAVTGAVLLGLAAVMT
ncbi:hypothetical protein BJF85_00445 [Saccharomonospora sp. CUA-673]|uniref:hypothetical protein n=1 Tax=Saccharomonospora sp. CUA-673 TaxID=1904969 RepID=UPI000959C2FB|nr:hypothetical protein [Saccharomonospora sp. CUA-673]OLT47092.1 hypothetical protein BJF85_00445 [Saccharomonospora sp. CUA-673]